MAYDGICLNCFAQRGDYDVCPYCGFVAGTMPAEGYLLFPGFRLWGRYVLGTVIGTGGFGVTYRAWDTRLNTMVAIKEFYPQNLVSRIPGESKVRVFSGDKQEAYHQQLQRFLAEAKSLAQFANDEHIVRVLDYFEDNGTAYIVMEYLDGETLKQYIERSGGRIPVKIALAFTTALLKALSSIHAKGIIHRDISPDNIFILRDGTIKVLDFGAARFSDKDPGDFTAGIVVKKGYAPPEQYRTNMKQGVWTDIYAAGATFYKMVTGITPEESIERTEKDSLRAPSQTGAPLDGYLDKAVMKAMALRPDLRFKSADAMLAALENRTTVDFPEEELKKRRGRNRILAVVSIVLILAMVGLIARQIAVSPRSGIGSGTPIDETAITPDTITILVNEQSPRDLELFTQLAKSFTQQFPQHTVTIETYRYEQTKDADFFTRFTSPDAPSIFGLYLEALEEADVQYRANLAPVFASLNPDDYYFLAEYYERQHDHLYYLPTSFTFEAALIDNTKAKAQWGEEVHAIETFDQLLAWEDLSPGSVQLYPSEMPFVMAQLDPTLIREDKVDEFVRYVGSFAEQYRANTEYHYSGDHVLDLTELNMHGSDWSKANMVGKEVIPLLSNGKLACNSMGYYSVSSYITPNRQQLAMLFMRFMLSEKGQNIMHLQNANYFPLHKTVLKDYLSVYPQFSFLTTTYKDKLDWHHYGSVYLAEFDRMVQDPIISIREIEDYARATLLADIERRYS